MKKKYKYVRQIDETDCGAACLATICQYYHLTSDLNFIKKISRTDKYGTNMLGLYEAALQIGFQAEGLYGTMEELLTYKIKGPYIAHVIIDDALEHYIVVLEHKESTFIVADPAKGIRELTNEEFNKIWTGHILTLAYNNKIKKNHLPQKALFSFLGIIKNYKYKFFIIALLSINIVALNISTSFFFNHLIDNIIPHKLSLQLVIISFLLVLIHIWIALLNVFRSKLISFLAKSMNQDIMNNYIFKILHIPYDFYSKYTTGDMVSRLQDADIVREALSQIVITVLMDFLMMVFGLYVLFSIHRKLFVVSIFILIGYAITISFFNKSIYNLSINLRQKESIMTSHFIELIDGIEVIKSYCAENHLGKKAREKVDSFIELYSKGVYIFSKQSILSNAVMNIGQAIVITIGGKGVINSEISLGSLIMFYSLFFMCISPVKNIIDLLPMLHRGEVSALRLKEVLDIDSEDIAAKDDKNLSLYGDIDINNVTFRYGNRQVILNKCSLFIKKGQKIALVGNCGSGKSTLAKLLLRLYLPENGYIKINGYNIENIPLYQLRKKIAYIPQSIFLFQGSILENIKMWDSSIEDNAIISFFHNTPIEMSIEKFPAGYHTLLTEKGNNISGGQKQIIALARALFRQADIFIFDEATSAIDTLTREIIEETVNNLGQHATIIVITHQLNSLKSYDQIYTLEEGKIIS